MKYDLVIFGGGTSGIAAAYIAAKHGLNTLLVEKTDVLGGSITQGLVVPSMKVNSESINTEFFSDLKVFADKYSARHTYLDNNDAWFNPELLKIVLDIMLENVKCNVLFSCEPLTIYYNQSLEYFECVISHKILSLHIDTSYIIDATASGKIFKLLNCDFQKQEENFQSPSLRFIMSNIDIKIFADWILKFDTNRDVTTVEYTDNQIYLSTACTWDSSRNWALAPIFKKAVDDGVLEYEDTAYFQVFSIPKMPDALAFNCPRIILEDYEDINDPFVYSRALKQGRERIYRLSIFCKKYLKGFKNAYISHISDMLGQRESYRVKCKETMTIDNILSDEKPENIALSCDYPIDIHTNKNNTDVLNYTKRNYYLPVDALISDKYNNLYAVGRILSADFKSQSALRTQISCFSMGEAAAKDILKKIN